MTTSRRISYVLPAPTTPVPLLALPPIGNSTIGRIHPLLVQKENAYDAGPDTDLAQDHPRHCLGVAALALDTTTKLAGKGGPEGILYTGGRDGLVASWELSLPHLPRQTPRWSLPPGQKRVRWERLEEGASWDDEDDEGYSSSEEEDGMEEQRGRSLLGGGDSDEEGAMGGEDLEAEGWIGVGGGEGARGGRGRRRKGIKFEDRWELDQDQIDSRTPTTFRQSVQSHTDWVNDILLCNMNQTVITASSDRTIRAWNPHSQTESGSPVIVGVHMDYAKTVAFATHPQMLFSGGLDHKILVWDIHQPRPNAPVMKLAFPDSGVEGSRGSVYALTTNAMGSLVAAGSPERVVRIWDPRTGGGQAGVDSVAKLVGHSDNIRAILMSEDGRYLLSGSSDCTIKLWSLAAQRCLHTFSHHTDSVWALFSDHPNLERFFSGDRAGYLCVTDVEGCQADYSEGECLVLAREEMEDSREGTQGICQIAGMDEEFVWTATGAASVNCWRDVGRKSARAGPIMVNTKGEAERGTPLMGSVNGHGSTAQTSPTAYVSPPAEGLLARNKRLSFDNTLDRVESRELKTVAFAPETTDRVRLDSPRRASMGLPILETSGPSPVTPSGPFGSTPASPSAGGRRPGVSTAGSVMSMDSYVDGEVSMNGLPISSLICLGLPETPYLPTGGPAAASNLYSASALSVPHPHAGSTGKFNPALSLSSFHHARVPSQSSHMNVPHHAMPPTEIARREFEEREIVEEAEPLRAAPEEVIKGRHGLIRASILNDRIHVLTVDTSGQVAIWDIIRCECVGRFSSADIAEIAGEQSEAASKSRLRRSAKQINPREALEIVRERIEGESMTVTWCSVDARIGSLTVHLEEARCFDAEVYADEVGVEEEEYKEDQRLNLGKWILTNLFAGLIKAEARDIAQYTSSQAVLTTPSSTTSSLPPIGTGINRGSAAPHFIPIDAPPNRRLRSFSSLNNAMSPGITSISLVGASTPAMTPAILPAMSSSLGQDSNFRGLWAGSSARDRALTAIPQSPPSGLPTNSSVGYSPMPSGQKSPKVDANGGKDYFSFRSAKARDSKDPSPTRKSGEADTAVLSTSATTPGGGLMGRFKGLGKGGKKTPGFETMTAVAASPEEGQDDKDPGVSEEVAAQLQVLAAVRSHPFAPPTPSEAPPLVIPPNVALLISEETKDAGAWAVTYRSMVGRTEQDIEPLEMAAPGWMLDWLFSGRGRLKDAVKLCFVLEPWQGGPEKDRLPAMPVNNSRLTANRVLRIRKIVQYIYEKIEMQNTQFARRGSSASLQKPNGSTSAPFSAVRKVGGAPTISSIGSQDDGQERPEEVLEVLCGEIIVPIKMTLAAVRQYMWNGGGDVTLYYRLRSD